jgi:hypothetical protein
VRERGSEGAKETVIEGKRCVGREGDGRPGSEVAKEQGSRAIYIYMYLYIYISIYI